MWVIKEKVTKQSKNKLIGGDNRMGVTRGKGEEGELGNGGCISGTRKLMTFGGEHTRVYRYRIVMLHT